MTRRPIKPEVIETLRRAQVSDDGLQVRLPEMNRDEYVPAAKVLTDLGGKWNRKAAAILFPSDVRAKLDAVLNGERPNINPLDFFWTPPSVVQAMIDLVANNSLNSRTRALEPSAGNGAIADALLEYDVQPDCVEMDAERAHILRLRGHTVLHDNFLTFTPPRAYDVILMNPPFRSETDANAYVQHVHLAADMLAPGGELVTVMPAGVTFRQDKRIAALRELFDRYGHICQESIGPGDFKNAGTGITCVLGYIHRPH